MKKTTTTTTTKPKPKTNNTVQAKKPAVKTVGTTASKQAKPAAKAQAPQASIPKTSPPKAHMTIPLTALVSTLQSLTEQNKTAFIIDPKGQAHVFFKYKGSCYELNQGWEREKLVQDSSEKGVEMARKAVLGTLRTGEATVWAFDELRNLNEYFKSGNPYNGWWKPEIVFDHKKFLQEDFYKKVFMREEEDKDVFGEPGGFYANEKFSLSLIYHQQEKEKDVCLPEIFEKIGLDHQLFTIIQLDY